ncbi:MAG TPA: DNA polymerase III subunit alpha [Planctomycetes bacterium]|nr:DNA polymerase III subunit alpha [Planctomycetota bacterium]
MPDFTHLHVLSHYSLLKATPTVSRLLEAVEKGGMDAVALTDTANLFGAFELQSAAKDLKEKYKKSAEEAAKLASEKPEDTGLAAKAQAAEAKHGVTALIGCQVNVAPLGMREKSRGNLQLVLIAASEKGYFDLAELVSLGWKQGFYFEPRVDIEAIARYSSDLVCLTGAGDEGFLNSHLRRGSTEEARRQLGVLKDIFADRLWVELADHLLDGPVSLRQGNVQLAREVGVPLVATNWVHYLSRQDAEVHDVMLAISDATTLSDPKRPHMPSKEFHLKSPDEMAALFSDLPEAISNTRAVVERCAKAKIPTGSYHLPTYPCPNGQTEADLMRELCAKGLSWRYATITDEHRSRLEFELKTIIEMGFPAYFLIVSDFIMWAKRNDIPVGPGRGSAAGSLVAYCLGITDICPLRYGLLFERFLNPGRKSMPDIDIDFCQTRREEVLDYVRGKYGAEAVTNIMTLGTMKARMAIKDVARAYEWSPEESQELANLVPKDPSGKHDLQVCLGRKPLDKATNTYGTVDGMLKRYDGDPRTRQVLDAALSLEKLGRSLGVHACGVIIAPKPVHQLVPVCVVKSKPSTMFNMTQVEKAGLLKMDFLGLKTMTILKKCVDIVKACGGPAIDLLKIPLDDPATFRMLGTGRTLGIFQCESPGFQNLIARLKPDRFEDMIALVALYRPGPLKANMHMDYCDRKQGIQKVEYPHPVLENVLKETYGLYIYQEQVMSISRELCGFAPSQADDLRKAMGKKDKATLAKLKDKFIDGAWTLNQFPREKCEEMWDKILGFAEYCFNKSHSACYGLIAYWTAWFKANHYAAFMTANLIFEMGNKDKMTEFVEELGGQAIPVLPPDVNESGWEFTLVQKEGRSQIRFGFGGVKGIGEGAAEALIATRKKGGPFDSLYGLCERVDTRTINKRVVEALIKVGACDSLHPNRRALHESMEKAFDRGQKLSKSRQDSQQTLFAAFEADTSYRDAVQGYPEVPDWSAEERLGFEKQLTGYWISDHPVRAWRPQLGAHASVTTRQMATTPDGYKVAVLAAVTAKRMIKTKTGNTMCILSLEDEQGAFEAVLFGSSGRGRDGPSPCERFAGLCEPDTVALFAGSVERRNRGGGGGKGGGGGGGEDEGGDETMRVGGEDDDEHGPIEGADSRPAIPGLVVSEVVPASRATELLVRSITIAIDATTANAEQVRETERLLAEHSGDRARVHLSVHTGSVAVSLVPDDRWRVHPSAALVEGLRRVWGDEHVLLELASKERLLAG